MPISLAELKSNTRTVVIPYFDDAVRVTYLPSELTPTVESQIRVSAVEDDNSVMLDVLSRLIVEWDVMDGDEPLPHTPEVLTHLPTPFLSAIFQGIREDMAPKPKSGRSSFAR